MNLLLGVNYTRLNKKKVKNRTGITLLQYLMQNRICHNKEFLNALL